MVVLSTDNIPDVSIARISVWKEEQILAYAAKAISYRENLQTSRLWSSHLTFTSGGKLLMEMIFLLSNRNALSGKQFLLNIE
jgi:hypothetical protein